MDAPYSHHVAMRRKYHRRLLCTINCEFECRSVAHGENTEGSTRGSTHIFFQLQAGWRRERSGRGDGSGYPVVSTFGRPACCPGSETGGRRSHPLRWCQPIQATVLQRIKINAWKEAAGHKGHLGGNESSTCTIMVESTSVSVSSVQ